MDMEDVGIVSSSNSDDSDSCSASDYHSGDDGNDVEDVRWRFVTIRKPSQVHVEVDPVPTVLLGTVEKEWKRVRDQYQAFADSRYINYKDDTYEEAMETCIRMCLKPYLSHMFSHCNVVRRRNGQRGLWWQQNVGFCKMEVLTAVMKASPTDIFDNEWGKTLGFRHHMMPAAEYKVRSSDRTTMVCSYLVCFRSY